MALKDLTLSFPQEVVSFAGGSFAVRGLSLEDISVLVSFHKERLAGIVEQFMAVGPNGEMAVAAENALDFASQFTLAAPAIAAHAIALAEVRDEGVEPQWAVAIRLPVDVQVDALEKLLRLTFQTEGGAKKVMETVARAFGGMVNFSGLFPKT